MTPVIPLYRSAEIESALSGSAGQATPAPVVTRERRMNRSAASAASSQGRSSRKPSEPTIRANAGRAADAARADVMNNRRVGMTESVLDSFFRHGPEAPRAQSPTSTGLNI